MDSYFVFELNGSGLQKIKHAESTYSPRKISKPICSLLFQRNDLAQFLQELGISVQNSRWVINGSSRLLEVQHDFAATNFKDMM